MFKPSEFSHTAALLAGEGAGDARVSRAVPWVVWVIGNDGTAFELDAADPRHAGVLANAWINPRGPAGGRALRCEIRKVDRLGDTETFGILEAVSL